MTTQTSSSRSGRIGFTGVLAIVFIVLKLTGNIGWSWLWVLSPLWIPIAVISSVLLVLVIAAVITASVKK